MRLKTLIAVAVAGAFALPLAAQASVDGDRMILAQAGGPSGASSVGTGPTGGTPSPSTAGEPKAPAGERMGERRAEAGATGRMNESFSMIDKNNDGQISRAEWDAYFRSDSSGAAAGGGTGTTGTTAGPGEASPRTAPSSDTATTPSTSGTGKAQ
jgi:hypothetical protein